MHGADLCESVSVGQCSNEPPQISEQKRKNTGRQKDESFADNEMAAGEPGGYQCCHEINKNDIGVGDIGKCSVDECNKNTENSRNIAAQSYQKDERNILESKRKGAVDGTDADISDIGKGHTEQTGTKQYKDEDESGDLIKVFYRMSGSCHICACLPSNP